MNEVERLDLDLSALDRDDFVLAYGDPSAAVEAKAALDNRRAGIRRAAIKRRLLSLLGRGFRRTEDYVQSYYSRWSQSLLSDIDPESNKALRPVIWRDRVVMLSPLATKRVALLRLIATINAVKPRRVLEVGCGNGMFPFLLACVFPEIEFHGLELSPEGVDVAHRFQLSDRLPDTWIRFIPVQVADASAFRNASISQGSARSLPYDDRHFDLVFTCVALEQMEEIRDDVLKEISRVCRDTASFIEPFRDVNPSGVQRQYVYSMNYFQGQYDDLDRYGFARVYSDACFPQVPYMNIAHVVARKRDSFRDATSIGPGTASAVANVG